MKHSFLRSARQAYAIGPCMFHRMARIGILAAMGAVAASGCAPTFQDARLVPPGHLEITPSVSGAGVSAEGESEYLVNTFAVQTQVGIHERINLGAAYARFQRDNGGSGLNTIAFGPRFGVVKDRFAVTIPFSFAVGEDIDVADTWQIHPTALFTVPVSTRVDFNPSVRLLIPTCEGCGDDTLVGFGAGFGARAGQRFTIRPEAGILVNPGESGVVWTFGVGVSVLDR